jgi:hypothetical protein
MDETLGPFPCKSKRYLSSSDRFWGTPNLLLNGYQGIFLWSNMAEHEANHSSLSSAEAKNVRSSTSASTDDFMENIGKYFFLFYLSH